MDTLPEPSPGETITAESCVFGFFATEPQFTHTENGVPKVYARYGVERHRLEDDGSTTRLEPIFRSIVFYRDAAEVVRDRFRKGDLFIAQGQVKQNADTGKDRFEARRIGHNALRTVYDVDRTPRRPTTPAVQPQHQELDPHRQPATPSQGITR